MVRSAAVAPKVAILQIETAAMPRLRCLAGQKGDRGAPKRIHNPNAAKSRAITTP